MVVGRCSVVGVSVDSNQAKGAMDVQFDIFTKVAALLLHAGGMPAVLYEH